MKARATRQELAELTPFGDLTLSGTRRVGLGPAVEGGYTLRPDPHRLCCGGGAVALLRSPRGCFGWRLNGRQAAALARAGFTCRSWT